MDKKDIAEQAYKNGYEQALKDHKLDTYRTGWKAKFFEAKKEIERLTGEKSAYVKDYEFVKNEYASALITLGKEGKAKAELQKQVDELKDERENMQAEILRFEDMKFTQEHCDLYSENEALKQWLKRLNADLEYEKNCGKQQTKQAVKDTADKIFRQVLKLYQGLSKAERETMTFEWKLLDLAVEYGVEVE